MSDPQKLGKAAGTDLLEGKLTLPLIMLLDHEPEMRSEFEQIMITGTYQVISRDEIKNKLINYGVLNEIKARSNEHVAVARKNLEVLSRSEYRSCLTDTLDFVANRNY
jgi:geranylgeranyl pyrophosphate synthase